MDGSWQEERRLYRCPRECAAFRMPWERIPNSCSRRSSAAHRRKRTAGRSVSSVLLLNSSNRLVLAARQFAVLTLTSCRSALVCGNFARLDAIGFRHAPYVMSFFGGASRRNKQMADDLKKRAPQDSSRINVHEPWEVKYRTPNTPLKWTKVSD